MNYFRRFIDKFSRHIAYRVGDKIEPKLQEIKIIQENISIKISETNLRIEAVSTGVHEALMQIADLTRRGENTESLVSGLHHKLETLLSRLERIRRETEFNRHYRSAYLGEGISVVWLPDDTIMYINSNDEGGPSALISGGRYEEEYFSVFRSFLSPSSLVLDIGANLGIYAIRTAQFFRDSPGRVIAFEPHPLAFELFQRSKMHNGFHNQIDARQVALSDQEGEVTLYYPERHIGGGGYTNPRDGSIAVRAKLEVLDNLLPDQEIDLVKIDVEGNELRVLRGMKSVIARSPRIAILFEKLQTHTAEDRELYELLSGLGLQIYAVESESNLRLVDLADFLAFSGYCLAARAETVGVSLDRRFFTVGWRQLSFPVAISVSTLATARSASGSPGEIIFHGPYWYLEKGRYRLTFFGRLDEPIVISITEQFGVEVVKVTMHPEAKAVEFEAPYDLRKFECVARASLKEVQLSIQFLKLQRI